jgi:hypothetical protein
LVDRNISGAARILRQRVEQVIQTNEETISAYKLANLFGFYRGTFSRLLGIGSLLVEYLGDLESEAFRQFRSLMRDHMATLHGDSQRTPADLSPPEFLRDALEQLSSIMNIYETALTSSNSETDFHPILAEAFDPFLAACESMAKNLGSPSDSIFLVNCMVAARTTLSPFEFTQKRKSQLIEKIDEESGKLTENQYSFFRTKSGLDALIGALGPLTDAEADVAIGALELVQPAALTHASQTLDDFLPSALMDAMENVRYLQDSRLARNITEVAAERFCSDFEQIEAVLIRADEVAKQDGEYQDDGEGLGRLRTLFPRTSGEIRVLLS